MATRTDTPSKPSPYAPPAKLPSSGVWARQVLFGGKRLQDEFVAHEPFILRAMEHAGDVPLEDGGKLVPKTVLTVSRKNEPGEVYTVGTLSGAIYAMIEHVSDGDLPAVVYWEEVKTNRGLQDAVVLTAVELYTGA